MPGERHNLFGLAAEFESPEAILDAAQKVHAQGYCAAEAYTPFPVEGLPEALGYRRTLVPMIVLIGALAGAMGGYLMQWFANVVHLPWNIGGKPPNSWPMFIPITFECAILLGALAGAIGMLAMNRLPKPFHPMFRLESFARASRDRFFLCIETSDPNFDLERTRQFLEGLHPLAIMEVAR
jgi:Alternative complex III, ActD subunit